MKRPEQNDERRKKILYTASTESHLKRFHMPYIVELRRNADVFLMANGTGVDFPIAFEKNFFSPKNVGAVWQIRKILKRENFDLVILNTSLAAFLIRIAMVGMKKRPRVLNIVHGYLFSDPAKGIKDRIMLFCERITRRYTDALAVMNAEDLVIAERRSLCKGTVTFLNGMGIPEWGEQLPAPDLSLRASFADRPEERILTFVGELSGRKNQIFLIRALARLRREGLPLKLVLVGEGSERGALEREIAGSGLSDTVFLTGNREPVLPYLAITDLYVSASRIEGLPFNLMEAMACGLPIVASDIKGQRDLLENTPERLFAPENEDAFCEAVRTWYASGSRGIGAVAYPELENYRLNAVFRENIRWMKGE